MLCPSRLGLNLCTSIIHQKVSNIKCIYKLILGWILKLYASTNLSLGNILISILCPYRLGLNFWTSIIHQKSSHTLLKSMLRASTNLSLGFFSHCLEVFYVHLDLSKTYQSLWEIRDLQAYLLEASHTLAMLYQSKHHLNLWTSIIHQK